MPSGYLPFFAFLLVTLLFPIVTLLLTRLIRPSAPNPAKLDPYECGIPVESGARARISVRFYLVAILFVLFDVETVFLFPWALRYRQLGWFGVAEATVFLGLLAVGYVWAWKKGALDWA